MMAIFIQHQGNQTFFKLCNLQPILDHLQHISFVIFSSHENVPEGKRLRQILTF